MYKYGDFIHFHLVDVPDIESDIPITDFDRQALELLANKIVETGCLLKPLILKQITPMHLKVIMGHFEYHAAVLANKMDKKRILSGMVSAFVVKKELEMQAIEQAHCFEQNMLHQSPLETPSISQSLSDNSSANPSDLIAQIAHLTRAMQTMQATFSQEMQAMQREMQKNANQQAEYQQQLLQVIKGLSSPISTEAITHIIPPISTPSPIIPDVPTPAVSYPTQDRSQEILNALNNCTELELKQKLKQMDGFADKKAANLAKEIVKSRVQSLFSSMSDVKSRVKGVRDAIMRKILLQFPI